MNGSEMDNDRPAWVTDAFFYQVFPDRFANGDPTRDPRDVHPWGSPPDRDHFQGGDFEGLLHRLGHLARLGVTALWLTPIFAAGTNHRYDTHDYLKVDPRLGDEGLLKEVVDEAHNLGIRVLLDGVFNHCGSGFWAFRDVVENGAASPFLSWFDVRQLPIDDNPPTYQTCGGAAYLPKLNTRNREVRDYLLEVATYWIDAANIDGWRLDVPWKVPHDFWQEFRVAVREVKPDAYLVGELWRDPGPWLDVFDGAMNYRLRDVLLDYCIHDDLDAEDTALELSTLVRDHGPATPWMLNLLGCHDTPRLRTLAGGDAARAHLAQTAMFTLPGAPLIYYGDEIGMEGGDDPRCRAAMPADPAAWWTPETDAMRQLATIRHAHPALRRGDFQPLLSFNGLLAYRRSLPPDQDEVVVVLNVRNLEPDVTIPYTAAPALWEDALGEGTFAADSHGIRLGDIPATSALVLRPVDNDQGVFQRAQP